MKDIDILIVDDSPAFNHLTKLTLGKVGVKGSITELSNGQKALHYLEDNANCPDVILLDINMPVMDGFDFLEEYKAGHRCLDKTIIYMLTSSAQEVDKIKANAFGIVKDYFEKPLTEENVHQIMADISR